MSHQTALCDVPVPSYLRRIRKEKQDDVFAKYCGCSHFLLEIVAIWMKYDLQIKY